jgi:hypothetical protein
VVVGGTRNTAPTIVGREWLRAPSSALKKARKQPKADYPKRLRLAGTPRPTSQKTAEGGLPETLFLGLELRFPKTL